jgi:N-acetylmuramoyl-L-alanine amidase
MMIFLLVARLLARFPVRLILSVVVVGALLAAELSSQTPTAYTVYSVDAKRTLPFRTAGNADMVPLDQVASLFNLRVAEDPVVNGLTVQSRGQTILLIAGQSFASIGPGRVVSLPAPIQRDRTGYQVPIEFLRQALAPALNLKIEVRRTSHLVLIGDVKVPEITPKIEHDGTTTRLTLTLDSATSHRITRDGNRVSIKFDAAGVDLAPLAGAAPDLVSAVHADGSTVIADITGSVAALRTSDPDDTHIALDLTPQNAPPAPPPQTATAPPATPAAQPPAPPPPAADASAGAGARAIVLDPGHGGDDAGARGLGKTVEKDYVLQFARRLKAAIESRIGVRVLLTRDNDDNIGPDQRTALANNNKADLFVSLHANASLRTEIHGAEVLSLGLDQYQGRGGTAAAPDIPVPVVSGGTRSIDFVPWDFAQLPYADRSAGVASVLVRHLTEHGVPLSPRPMSRLPLRPLVGANMPAVMLEVGYLTNTDDEQALNGPERPDAIISAVLDTIGDLRRGAIPGPGVRP